MKTFSNKLHELIHSLTKKERLLFKQQCLSHSVHDNSGYLTVFEMYEKQAKANEQEIKDQCKLKNFSRIKNYLQVQVEDFISEFNTGSPISHLGKMLSAAETMYKRSLYKQSLDILTKALKLAQKNELYSYSLIITEFVSKINLELNLSGNYAKANDSERELDELLEKIKREIEFNNFMGRVRAFKLKKNIVIRNEVDLKELTEIIAPILKKGENYPLSLASKWKYYMGLGLYYVTIKNYESASYHFKQCVVLFEKIKNKNREQEQTSIYSLTNLMYSYSSIRNYKMMKQTLDELKNIQVKFKSNEHYKTDTCFLYEVYWLRHGAPANKTNLLKKLDKEFELKQEEIRIDFRIHTINNLSVNYFMQSDFKKALYWVNKMDNLENPAVMKSVTNLLKIYRLILFYEMGQFDYLEYAINNTYRNLLVNTAYYQFEKIIISSLKKLIVANTPVKQKEIFEILSDKLSKLKNDFYENNVFWVFNFYGWARCKFNNEGFDKIETF